MTSLPPEASAGVRASIVEALKIDAYFLYEDGRRFLELEEFDPDATVDDLLAYLEGGKRLYILRGAGIKRTKYQCCLDYGDIILHFKLTLDEMTNEMFVMIGVHKHNTGYAPLPE